MAEKKFFVDINLQGSALTNAKIGTNTGIGSTEGAFGYNSGSHRLQYFNGTATQNVANLSDISAVTGGLIFQGGYDPTTDTPDITDGTALKGFFWAATAAGTFLGESVQVGDSIVAKVDAAGATIADWLILQGNIVIATDSVDGISRLATQAEADAGTEAGAVVITPATLQGKIDAQITPEISNKLPLAGGTMSGSIDMGNNTIENVDYVNTNELYTHYLQSDIVDGNIALGSNLNFDETNKIINLPAPTNGGDAANKTYVDDNTSNKLPLAGGVMSGNINLDGNNIANAGTVVTEELTSLTVNGIDVYTQLNMAAGNTITNLPAPTNGGDATNKTYVDGAASTAQANAEATASADATTKADAAQAAAEAYADSLAPNYDAAGAAATAESNANDYTDTEIAAQSYNIEIQSEDWTENDGIFEFTITHNLNSTYPVASFFDSNNRPCELSSSPFGPSAMKLLSNIRPDAYITASFVAAR